jgi:hypothetical protein
MKYFNIAQNMERPSIPVSYILLICPCLQSKGKDCGGNSEARGSPQKPQSKTEVNVVHNWNFISNCCTCDGKLVYFIFMIKL